MYRNGVASAAVIAARNAAVSSECPRPSAPNEATLVAPVNRAIGAAVVGGDEFDAMGSESPGGDTPEGSVAERLVPRMRCCTTTVVRATAAVPTASAITTARREPKARIMTSPP